MNRKSIFWSIILTFLITSVIFSIVLIFFFYKALDKYNDTRLNPLKVTSATIDSTKIYDYVLFGDSHVQYWKNNSDNTLNLGVTGQTSEQAKNKFEILKIQIKGGKYLIISVGANDVKSIATNPDTSEIIVKNCLNNIEFLVDENKDIYQKIYLLTVPPDFNVSFPYNLINYQKTYDSKSKINKGIREIAQKNNVFLIDAFKIFEKENQTKYSEDGVHMNAEAYKTLDSFLK